jgi:alkylmercury lyase
MKQGKEVRSELMLTSELEELAERLGRFICRCPSIDQCRLSLNDLALCRPLILSLTEGEPVSPEKLAAATRQEPADVVQAIQGSRNVELDKAGHIIGAGLTLRPTPHQVQVNGRILYTWCALDALMYPPLLGYSVQVESACAVTGLPVRMIVTPQSVKSITPPEAVVSIVMPQEGADIRESFCNLVNFLSSPEAAESWRSQHPEAKFLSVSAAYNLGQRLVANTR